MGLLATLSVTKTLGVICKLEAGQGELGRELSFLAAPGTSLLQMCVAVLGALVLTALQQFIASLGGELYGIGVY